MINKVVYNGYTFETGTNLVIQNVTEDSGVLVENNTYNKSNTNGGVLISNYKREKIIVIKGVLTGSSKSDLNDRIDNLKKYIFEGNKTIYLYRDTQYGVNTITKGNAILVNGDDFLERESYGITYCKFELKFLIIKGYLEDSLDTVLSGSGLSSNVTISTTYKGNLPCEVSTDITINTVNNIGEIQISNGTDTIYVNHTYSNSDILNIDGENQSIFLNGAAIDYEGFFPNFIGDDFTIKFYQSNGTSLASGFNIDYTFTYNNRYI